MNIKEIAPKLTQKLAIAINDDEAVEFAEALIESYKAELLKEVVEPVLYAEFAEDGGWLGDASEYADHLEEPHALFTSDQVAAAVLKATKLLESVAKPAGYFQVEFYGGNPMHQQVGSQYQAEPGVFPLYTAEAVTVAVNQFREQLTKSERRIAELEAENERLRDAVRQQESQVLREQATSLDIYQQLKAAQEDITEMRADHLMLVEENHALREQLAKAEQRVAEACYRALDEAYGNEYQLKAIGEYRKYMKEV